MSDHACDCVPVLDLQSCPVWSPSIYGTFCQLDMWQTQALELFNDASDDLQSTLFSPEQTSSSGLLDIGGTLTGPALLQHKALLEPHCVPFG